MLYPIHTPFVKKFGVRFCIWFHQITSYGLYRHQVFHLQYFLFYSRIFRDMIINFHSDCYICMPHDVLQYLYIHPPLRILVHRCILYALKYGLIFLASSPACGAPFSLSPLPVYYRHPRYCKARCWLRWAVKAVRSCWWKWSLSYRPLHNPCPFPSWTGIPSAFQKPFWHWLSWEYPLPPPRSWELWRRACSPLPDSCR